MQPWGDVNARCLAGAFNLHVIVPETAAHHSDKGLASSCKPVAESDDNYVAYTAHLLDCSHSTS